jgi:hypothetical protein
MVGNKSRVMAEFRIREASERVAGTQNLLPRLTPAETNRVEENLGCKSLFFGARSRPQFVPFGAYSSGTGVGSDLANLSTDVGSSPDGDSRYAHFRGKS